LEAVKEAMEAKAGIDRLGQMSGVASLDRNLAAEDAAYRRDLGVGEPTATGSDPMQHIMAARDVYVIPPPEVEPSPPTLAPAPASKLAKVVRTAALGTALLSAGAAGALGIPWAIGMFDRLSAESPTDQNTQYESVIEVE
jgi:hypothetical protein